VTHRPGFDQLHKLIVRCEIDVVMAWGVDRLGRSMQDLVAFLGELRAVGCDLYLHQQGVDTTTPAGRALFQMLGVFAEFERAIIVERVTIKGFEIMRMIRRRHCILIEPGVTGEVRFVNKLFDLAA
jgi:DNA invertase Pin-like site-specific DNA recombinase